MIVTSGSRGAAALLLAVLVIAAPISAPKPASAGGPSLTSFAGTWIGHTRSLVITRGGRAKEAISGGCCNPIIELRLRLSHPLRTSKGTTVLARVAAVRILDENAFTRDAPAPVVGQRRRLLLRRGVITEPFTRTNYCDETAGRRGVCGA